jgi:hypothetical protein
MGISLILEGNLQVISICAMAKNKKIVGDDELKPIDIPEEDDKILPLATEDEDLLVDDDDEEDEEEEAEEESF